jgi:succinyl-CoA synthetase alpha subunit
MPQKSRPDYILFDENTKAVIYNYQVNAIQRMVDYDYICQRKTPSVVAIVNPTTEAATHKCFWGSKEIAIPIYTSLEECFRNHPDIDTMANFASMRSTFPSTMEALDYPQIRVIALIAEGVPERRTKMIIAKARSSGVTIIGPATVGGLRAGYFRIGNTAGDLKNIVEAKLFRPGSVAYVSKSGGLSNELNMIIGTNTDGLYEGVALGGDRYPGTRFMDHIMRYENNPDISMIVMLGEIGGTDEYAVVDALKSGKIKKPLVAWCIGTSSKMFPSGVQFGHAGARADAALETSDAKNKALKEAGAIVPESFNDFDVKIRETYQNLVREGKAKPPSDAQPPPIPIDYAAALKSGMIRKPTTFTTTISDESGDELLYAGVRLSEVFEHNIGIGGVIGLLWFKRLLPGWGRQFIEIVLQLTADHGPAVSGAHNAIVAACAGKDLISSLVSGLLTIGPRFGGAVDGAAQQFQDALDRGLTPEQFVNEMKNKNVLIQGIGHRIKSVTNPDLRVTLLKDYVLKNFPSHKYLEYALEVEKITTSKRNNLILNVDGCIGICCLDMMASLGMSTEEIKANVDLGMLNGLFVLGRSIGIMGHVLDQKRQGARLYRHPWEDILFDLPKRPQGWEEYKDDR